MTYLKMPLPSLVVAPETPTLVLTWPLCGLQQRVEFVGPDWVPGYAKVRLWWGEGEAAGACVTSVPWAWLEAK